MGRGGTPMDKLCERYNLYRQFLVIVCWVCKWGNRCGHQGSVDNDNWHLDRWDLGGWDPSEQIKADIGIRETWSSSGKDKMKLSFFFSHQKMYNGGFFNKNWLFHVYLFIG